MSKRRRTSSAASRQDDEMNEESTPDQSPVPAIGRKRKKIDPSELCQQLYDSIRNIKKEDGTMLCDTFIRAPKRRQEPSYYEVVANPIDLLRVQQKLKTDSYDDIEELSADVELLVSNAKAFYKPDSIEYQDACVLMVTYNMNKMKLLETLQEDLEMRNKAVKVGRFQRKSAANDTDDTSETSSVKEDDFDPYEELFSAVMTAIDPADNRSLHTEFQLLPSKKLYPDYYDVIEHPIDLKFIATKIQRSAYTNLNDMEKDLLQMTKNACTFNEPGSQIYKDAKTLKKIFLSKKNEIEMGKVKIVRNKRRGPMLSAITASLKDEPESSDDDVDDNLETEGDGPMWQLFDQLYNTANSSDHPNASGSPLGESLWKLPNRRFHPDYYLQIKKPISMAQIRNKLKKGSYANITEMTADLYLMLDNAKKAHSPISKVFKDACKMQKVLNQKLVDAGVDDESEPEDEDVSVPSVISTANSSPSTPTPGSIAQNATTNIIVQGSSSLTPVLQTTIVGPKKKGRARIHPIVSPQIQQQTTIISNTNTNTASPNLVGNTTNIVQNSTITPKGRFPNNPILKMKLLGLQKFLTDYTVAGRKPMTLFMEKPSKKLYPDYYEVIQHPIDMNTIEVNIKTDRYGTLDDVVGDYRLMFSNCRKYNEEGSTIYEDANILERALNEKLKEFSGINDRRLTPKIVKTGRKTYTPMDTKLRQLYDAIRDYRDPKGLRHLALIFMKLPSKNDYPDYYDIIKNPIDMEKISLKLKQQLYDNLDEIAGDFMLMFENACKYNEPDSQIYKDALVLQQVCIQTKKSLKEGTDESVPDVSQAVQELLLLLFTTFYNHQDEEGRCFSDSLAELSEYDEIEGIKVRAISLDLIKRRLDKNLYKRLDIFQEDVFSCLDRARRLSRTDSQVFEDSIELQSYFIKKRDEICKGGDILSSPALSYSAMHLSAAVEAVRQTKLLQEEQEQDIDSSEQQTIVSNTTSSTTAPLTTQLGESMTINQKVYSPGDFVYYEVPDNKIQGIIYIERLWTNTENVKMMYGNVFLRPFETYHVTSRKFLEQEVFKSDIYQAIPLTQLQNKCHVMSVKDYFKYRPEGFLDKDVYVCESRYITKPRSFKKIKNWPFQLLRSMEPIKLISREQPLEPKRIVSVFKERVEKHKGELAELQLQEALMDKDKPNIVVYANGSEDGFTYYEQYNTICSGVIKTGDYIYVATETGRQSIAQINSIWETKDGKSFFRGPWLLTPPEVPCPGNRLFYRQEVMLSTVQETSPIIAIVGRCHVMEFLEYIASRPTEIPESDVYVCESIFDEMKKQIRRIQGTGGLRKFNHSQMVALDEIYHFKQLITPIKVSASEIAALQESLKQTTTNIIDMDIKNETQDILGCMDDSLDGGPPSVGSDFIATASPAPSTSIISTPILAKKIGKVGKKLVTGYILYSSEVRKGVVQLNPEAKFGDISRMIGNEWRSLPASDKQIWEEKAQKYNEDNAAKLAERLAEENGCPSPAPIIIIPQDPVPNTVYECCWDKCDCQFEDSTDCIDHCIAEQTGHVQTTFTNLLANNEAIEYTCMWRNCLRLKKQSPPFPQLQRLIKHVREVHINKGNGKVILPHDRSKNYMPSKKEKPAVVSAPVISSVTNNNLITQTVTTQMQGNTSHNVTTVIAPQLIQQQHAALHLVPAPPAEPLFVTVPPRPQRVLHSEAYIKYIEGLQNDTRHITPWEKTIKAQQDNVLIQQQLDINKLPVQWLGNKVKKDTDENVINALWSLRNFMLKDVLQLNRHNYY